jgi:hypothetical protein
MENKGPSHRATTLSPARLPLSLSLSLCVLNPPSLPPPSIIRSHHSPAHGLKGTTTDLGTYPPPGRLGDLDKRLGDAIQPTNIYRATINSAY